MNKFEIIKIIKETIDQWFDDDSGLLDKYYNKKFGNQNNNISNEKINDKVNGELIGYLTKKWSQPLKNPIPVFKNPRSLRNFHSNARGILTDSGDVYVAFDAEGLHLNILELLAQKNIIPFTSVVSNFGQQMPEEYIAIVRQGPNRFVQSTAYDEIPIYYETLFDYANEKHPYQFEIIPTDNIFEL